MKNNNNDSMQFQRENSYLESENAPYLEALYYDYCNGKEISDPTILAYFEGMSPRGTQEADHEAIINEFVGATGWSPNLTGRSTGRPYNDPSLNVYQLIEAFRTHGHRLANLDPLNLTKPTGHPKLSLERFNLQNNQEAKTIFNQYKAIYCQHIGFEFTYISNEEETQWLQNEIEQNGGAFSLSVDEKKNIFKDLTAAEGLEKYLGRRYVGKTRFSLEGLDSLIPCMNDIVNRASNHGVQEIVIGMAHRGRLNVLVNVLGKKPSDLLDYIDGKLIDPNASGDVTYHLGHSSNILTKPSNIREDKLVHLCMAFNPSHLEIIMPVVLGSTKAKQQRRNDKMCDSVLPVILHGDAAFAGQGVVMESFAMSQTRGFSVGGSLHIVTNNQVGFTTSNPADARSSLYCTDIAKMIEAPIFHVNADDPEAVIFVTRLAMQYRSKFKKDVVIDLIGYRRFGHNEADEPSATQPLMYNVIRNHPTPRALYAEKLITDKVMTTEEVDKALNAYQAALDAGHPVAAASDDMSGYEFAAKWVPYLGHHWRTEYDSRISQQQFQDYAKNLLFIPENFNLQSQVKRTILAREKMAQGEAPIDWGFAENLAYASLLAEGHAIRLCGEDVARGTFAHRHSVLHDQTDDKIYVPLEHITEKQASITIIDSLLSEEAVLGFEYGFSAAEPDTMDIWEAQYGDFVNGAQVVIDQFISSGEQKWGRLCGLVMLLPHGYEGAGPEHSSARLERFLQLCAQENMQVCMPSTPAQIFHLLRRQVLRVFRKPLIVMTPKSMLRNKLVVSSISDLTDGKFELVIPEQEALNISNVTRVVFCSGKVYYDLLTARTEAKCINVAFIRIEQLYPFPKEEVIEALSKYSNVKDFVWCQEEPQNQGAWLLIQHDIEACLSKQQVLTYAGRSSAAAPSGGFPSVHAKQQAELVKQALNLS